jgi:hypothetical protein
VQRFLPLAPGDGATNNACPTQGSGQSEAALSVYENPDEARSEIVRLMLRWWLGKCGADIPDRSDLDPVDLKPLLPNILISDVEHDPFRVRYRLVGTRAREATGFNIVGRYLDELLPTDPDEPWMADYNLAYRTRRPVLGVSSIKTTSGGFFTYEYGLFPLRKGGAAIEQFVAVEDYEDLNSTLLDLVEWRERTPKD